jgi:PspAA-like protein
MIIRIMGEGQLKLDDSAVDELNKLDSALEQAVELNDEAAFGSALHALLEKARAAGTALPADAIEPSELILPREGATIEEVRDLLSDGGLIPG